MSKLEQLSNIETQNLDIKNISDFFETIKSVNLTSEESVSNFTLKTENLRKDEVKSASEEEKELILKNFPEIQGRYLVVPKVI
jgi:aspartyl/glutamyl-tRNA(Asn/Gln) amidotransferase C subunit